MNIYWSLRCNNYLDRCIGQKLLTINGIHAVGILSSCNRPAKVL